MATKKNGDETVAYKKRWIRKSIVREKFVPTVECLCSFGGETRIVRLSRDINFDELISRMRELFEGAIILKYRQAQGDLVALVSVVNDDDVTNMMEEYDKLGWLSMVLFPHNNEKLIPSRKEIETDADEIETDADEKGGIPLPPPLPWGKKIETDADEKGWKPLPSHNTLIDKVSCFLDTGNGAMLLDEFMFNLFGSEFLIYSEIRHFLRICWLFPRDYGFYKDDIVQFPGTSIPGFWISLFDFFEKHGIFLLSGFDNFTHRPRYTIETSIFNLLEKDAGLDGYLRVDDVFFRFSKNSLHALVADDIVLLDDLSRAKELQTLFIIHKYRSGSLCINPVLLDFFWKLPKLEALDLSHTNILEIPSSIGDSTSLRYLNLSYTPISVLPESLCNVRSLRTLKLRGCLKLRGLPKSMWKASGLQHFDVDVATLLISMPPGLGNLSNLQTLPAFVVGKRDGCHLIELKRLKWLSGTLRILRLGNVSDADEAKQSALHEKLYLLKLELSWTQPHDRDIVFNVLENLRPHRKIQELRIVGYGGVKFPSWIGDPIFSALTTITIHNSSNSELVPTLGNLPRLKYLYLSDFNETKVIDSRFCTRNIKTERFNFGEVSENVIDSNRTVAFPSLQKFTLDGMPEMERWSGVEGGDFPNLLQLNMSGCSRVTALPELSLFGSLQELEISICPSLESFPEGGLPASLQCLVIVDCPLLTDQCNKDNGSDWIKLAHIPNVWFDHQRISLEQTLPKDISHGLRNNDNTQRQRNQTVDQVWEESSSVPSERTQVNEQESISNSHTGVSQIIYMTQLVRQLKMDSCGRIFNQGDDLRGVLLAVHILIILYILFAILINPWGRILQWMFKSDGWQQETVEIYDSTELLTIASSFQLLLTLKYMYWILEYGAINYEGRNLEYASNVLRQRVRTLHGISSITIVAVEVAYMTSIIFSFLEQPGIGTVCVTLLCVLIEFWWELRRGMGQVWVIVEELPIHAWRKMLKLIIHITHLVGEGIKSSCRMMLNRSNNSGMMSLVMALLLAILAFTIQVQSPLELGMMKFRTEIRLYLVTSCVLVISYCGAVLCGRILKDMYHSLQRLVRTLPSLDYGRILLMHFPGKEALLLLVAISLVIFMFIMGFTLPGALRDAADQEKGLVVMKAYIHLLAVPCILIMLVYCIQTLWRRYWNYEYQSHEWNARPFGKMLLLSIMALTTIIIHTCLEPGAVNIVVISFSVTIFLVNSFLLIIYIPATSESWSTRESSAHSGLSDDLEL